MAIDISLALSGGGMRGCAHIGVIKKLQELSLKPKYISGTSVGAVVGAFLADGFCGAEIEELFIRSKFSFDLNYFHITEALLSSKRMEELLRKNLRSTTFDQLQSSLCVCVTNYMNGQPEYIDHGNLIQAILASTAIPMVYHPVKINGILYVDGGVSRNLPTEPLMEYNLPVVGVHVNPLLSNFSNTSVSQKLDHTIHLLLREKLEEAMKHCSMFIEPEKLLMYSIFETKHIQELIQIGYDKTEEELKDERLKALLMGG